MILGVFFQSFGFNKNNYLALRVKSCLLENTLMKRVRASGM
jgi:hypothetical protein